MAAINEAVASSDLPVDLNVPAIGTSNVEDQEIFESITNPGKLLLLTSWRTSPSAALWEPTVPAARNLRHRQVRIIRDYGMFDRREAPQFYPPIEPISP